MRRRTFLLLKPRKLKFNKPFKRFIENNAKLPQQSSAGFLKHGKLGLKCLSACHLRFHQIEAMRRFLVKYCPKKGKTKLYFNTIVFNSPLTKKSLGVRMGKGKGKLDLFVHNVVRGQILFELSSFTLWHIPYIFPYVFERLPIRLVLIKDKFKLNNIL